MNLQAHKNDILQLSGFCCAITSIICCYALLYNAPLNLNLNLSVLLPLLIGSSIIGSASLLKFFTYAHQELTFAVSILLIISLCPCIGYLTFTYALPILLTL